MYEVFGRSENSGGCIITALVARLMRVLHHCLLFGPLWDRVGASLVCVGICVSIGSWAGRQGPGGEYMPLAGVWRDDSQREKVVFFSSGSSGQTVRGTSMVGMSKPSLGVYLVCWDDTACLLRRRC